MDSGSLTRAAPLGPPATRARPSPPLGISAPAAAAAAPRTDTGTGNASGSTSSARPVSPPHPALPSRPAAAARTGDLREARLSHAPPEPGLARPLPGNRARSPSTPGQGRRVSLPVTPREARAKGKSGSGILYRQRCGHLRKQRNLHACWGGALRGPHPEVVAWEAEALVKEGVADGDGGFGVCFYSVLGCLGSGWGRGSEVCVGPESDLNS